MAADRELIRVSDAERQAAAERLRAAMGEGRLDLLEYDNRLALAYAAVTYRDLDQLFTDLPAHVARPTVPAVARPQLPAAVARPVAVPTRSAGQPLALRILWGIWGLVVTINLVVWLLVGLGPGDLPYFWPMWLAVPGAALFGATIVVNAVRSHE
jgi:hypothetical protein